MKLKSEVKLFRYTKDLWVKSDNKVELPPMEVSQHFSSYYVDTYWSPYDLRNLNNTAKTWMTSNFFSDESAPSGVTTDPKIKLSFFFNDQESFDISELSFEDNKVWHLIYGGSGTPYLGAGAKIREIEKSDQVPINTVGGKPVYLDYANPTAKYWLRLVNQFFF